ncbi:MAG: hypothetical protein A2Y51_01740 [Gallionellales bacterium RIFCSPLOWO2_02_60_31]|nr:MAG: hypothetical protein A2Y51_01740 [Gallionellales bacterium RIFCSPLOWO2_02_60_31]
MLVRILMSNSHPEYRLVLPVEARAGVISTAMRVAIEQLGEWEERSRDNLDGSRPEHREAMEDIAVYGAYLWMISAAYTGRVEVVQSGQMLPEDTSENSDSAIPAQAETTNKSAFP